MTGPSPTSTRTVIPALLYRDVRAAVDWLCEAFGFEKHRVEFTKGGSVIYAELTFGNSMIMLGSVNNPTFRDLLVQPDQIGGVETQTCYLVVEDTDGLFKRAKAAGAAILLDISDDDDGGRYFTCQDVEGHIWNFGTYSPRATTEVTCADGLLSASKVHRARWPSLRVLAAGLAAIVSLAGAAAWSGFLQPIDFDGVARSIVQMTDPQNVAERRAGGARQMPTAERRTGHLDAEIEAGLATEQPDTSVAGRWLHDAKEQLAKEQAAREHAERTAREALDRLARLQVDLANSHHEATEAKTRASAALDARQAAEQATERALAQLMRESADKTAALAAAKTAARQLATEQAHRQHAERRAQEALQKVAKGQGSKLEAQAAVQRIEVQLKAALSARDKARREARGAVRHLRRVKSEAVALQSALNTTVAELAAEREQRNKSVWASDAGSAAQQPPARCRLDTTRANPSQQRLVDRSMSQDGELSSSAEFRLRPRIR